MRVLYFLEPNIELNNKLFRLGSIRNHLDKEIKNLKKYNAQVKLLLSDVVYRAARQEGFLNDVDCIVVSQDEVKKTLGDHGELYCFYGKNQPKEYKESKFYRGVIGNFNPDFIICYEGLVPYFKDLFPNAIIINNTLGMLSRAPYPELTILDPVGVYGDSFISERMDSIRRYKPSKEDSELVFRFKNSVRECVEASKIDLKDIIKGFDKYVLLPLQVSGYFAFDSYCNYKSQLEFVKDVISNTPRNIAVIVTTHGVENNVFDCDEGRLLLDEYDNLIYSKEIDSLRWASQHVIPFCHGVISVSSSVAFIAMLWDLPVYSPSHSHVKSISQESYKDFYDMVLSDKKASYDGVLEFFLLNYNVTTQEIHSGSYLYEFLLKCLEYKNSNREIDIDFYLSLKNKNRFGLFCETRFSTQGIESEKFSPNKPIRYTTPVSYFRHALESVDVVTFDIFDTLISRKIYTPNSLFDLMEDQAREIMLTDGVELDNFGGFRNLRERAANRVIRRNKKNKIDEITLVDIYKELRIITGITKNKELELRKCEISHEIKVTSERKYGRDLFNLAKDLGKKIALISDMYLAKSDIELLLKKNNFDINNIDIFVSSEFGVTKKNGKLFNVVRQHLGCDKEILHVGDNFSSDYINARANGLWAIHIPCASLNFESSIYAKNHLKKDIIQQSLGANINYGLISRKYYDLDIKRDSYFNSDPYTLGYCAGGSIILGFAKWLSEKFKYEKIEKVYFLARDGYLVKKVYDKLREYDNSLPPSEYLLASRRCYSTASFKNENDILSSVSLSFSKNKVGFILKKRYNLSKVSESIYKEAGFENENSIVDIKRGSQKRKFIKLLTLLKEDILRVSRNERNALKAYLDSKGVLDKEVRKCVVDIGHNATLQKYISEITDDIFYGFYFMTFSQAEKVNLQGLPVYGYLADFEDQKLSTHPYVKNIGMFEFLFLPSIPSFERFELTESGLIEHYVEGDESFRFNIIDKVHEGALEYINSVLNILDGKLSRFDLSKNHCIKYYIDFITKPYYLDVLMFKGVYFVDGFGGSEKRYLLSSNKYASESNFLKESWWRDGAYVLLNGDKSLNCDFNSIVNIDCYSYKPTLTAKVKMKRKFLKLLTKPHVVIKNRVKKYFLQSV